MSTLSTSLPGGTWTLGDLTVTRFGYGAMQLAGPGVMGPPADHDSALAVLREAVDLGITHVDTSDAYGPRVTNQLIREALHPYPDNLVLVSKVGARRDQAGGWLPYSDPDQLRAAAALAPHPLALRMHGAVSPRARPGHVGGSPDGGPGRQAPGRARQELRRGAPRRHR